MRGWRRRCCECVCIGIGHHAYILAYVLILGSTRGTYILIREYEAGRYISNLWNWKRHAEAFSSVNNVNTLILLAKLYTKK